jgi:hypothetical protein
LRNKLILSIIRKFLISFLSSCPYAYIEFPRNIIPTAINYEALCFGNTELSSTELGGTLQGHGSIPEVVIGIFH